MERRPNSSSAPRGAESSRIYMRDHQRELSFEAEHDQLLAFLAVCRRDTDEIAEVLGDARQHYGIENAEELAKDADNNIDQNAPFKIDLVERTLAFPGNHVDFAPRGVVESKDGQIRTYHVGHDFTLYDSDRNMFIDKKAWLNNERQQWRHALPDLAEGAQLDGIDLDDDAVRELRMWTADNDDRSPTINGRSVYELGGPEHYRRTG